MFLPQLFLFYTCTVALTVLFYLENELYGVPWLKISFLFALITFCSSEKVWSKLLITLCSSEKVWSKLLITFCSSEKVWSKLLITFCSSEKVWSKLLITLYSSEKVWSKLLITFCSSEKVWSNWRIPDFLASWHWKNLLQLKRPLYCICIGK